MTKKQKKSYIWDYYKLHIIGGIVLLATIISISSSIVNRKEYAFNLTVVGGYLDIDKTTEMGDDITKLLYEDDDKTLATVDYYSLTADQNNVLQMDYNMVQKFMAKVAARQVDVIVIPEEMYDVYLQDGFFLDLTTVTGLDILNSRLAQNEQGIFGVYLDQNKFYNIEEYENGKYIMAIVASSERIQDDVNFINNMVSKK
jgi:hypothetical protein